MDKRDNKQQRNPGVDANTRDENQHKQEQRTDEATGRVPSKGTDIPATTDADYAEREKGKRTTM